MSNFSKTISNNLNLFGGSPSSLWNAYNWNAFLWGDGTTDLPVVVVHLITNSLAPDSAIPAKVPTISFGDSLAFTSALTEEYLTDGNGYYYVFPSNAINHENQVIPSYTTGSANSTSWTTGTLASTLAVVYQMTIS